MQFRKFGPTQRLVSEIGLGCWQLGGSDWGDVSDEKALQILAAAVDQGVTFLDTADVYGAGRSETLIGRFLRQTAQRDKLFIATKLGRFFPDGKLDYSLPTLRAHTEASLRRLGVEALDLTQLHCIPQDVLFDGAVFASLRQLQKEGKIKAFGASVECDTEALSCLDQPGLASLQIIFNIFRPKPAQQVLHLAQARSVAIIVRLPLASGLLGGKITATTQFPQNDHRNYNRDGQCFNVGETFAGLPFALAAQASQDLRPLVPAGYTMAEMALRWILDHPGVSTIIPGASKVEQVPANVKASSLPPLTAQTHAALQHFYQTRIQTHIRGPY